VLSNNFNQLAWQLERHEASDFARPDTASHTLAKIKSIEMHHD
jgi:hypothetical protein